MILPPAMSLEEKWGYLSDPPDLTAQSIMTEGLKPIFHIAPPLKLFPSAEEITLDCNIPALKPFIEDWLARGIIEEIKDPTPCFFSRLFTVRKKSGKLRPIIDLSILNRWISTPKFRMETLEKIIKLITEALWGTSIDVTDAYLHVPIHPAFRKFFAFSFAGKLYWFLKMPFGLTTAPWAFSRVMKPIKIFLRRHGVSPHLSR